MKSSILALIFGGLLIGVAMFLFGVPRLLKTMYLIARITPYEQTVPQGPVILVLGDSTGYGTGADDNSKTIAGRIGSDFPNYTVINISKNGRTIEELRRAMEEKIDVPKAKLILLQIGGNDILQKHDVATVKAHLVVVFGVTKQKGDQVVMISSGNVGTAVPYAKTPQGDEYEAISRTFREMFITTAKEAGVEYIDLFHEPEDDVFYLEPEIYLAIDGLHPSNAGYGVWYESLRPVLKTSLGK